MFYQRADVFVIAAENQPDRVFGLRPAAAIASFVSSDSSPRQRRLALGFVGVLLLVNNAGGTLPAPAMRPLSIAHTNSQRLVRVVNSILDMEKIESGKVVFVLKRVEVRSLVEQAVEANRGFADGYNVRLRLDAASAAGDIRSDPDWLLQVVTNLLSNAVKFSPPGEEVVVAIANRNGTIRISVRDHGHGVPEDFKPRIFEKFAQADASDARQQGGTGLGLSIVKQIVTRLGGEVGFDDAPGGGAIFHVDLPGFEKVADNTTTVVDQPDDARSHDTP